MESDSSSHIQDKPEVPGDEHNNGSETIKQQQQQQQQITSLHQVNKNDHPVLKLALKDGVVSLLEQTEETPALEKDKTVSLTLDQVNNNTDELIALRGEGRYFGVTDVETGPICSNCHRRGHRRNNCKVVVCHACGLVDSHYETQCPKSMVCTNCGKKGHFKGNCEERMRRTFCTICESKNHSDDRCPSIWRSYLTKHNRETCEKLPIIYCYNCGREGHYGDECHTRRSSKTPNIDGSGFSGNNLPKELRDSYYRRKSNKRSNDDDNYNANFYDEDSSNYKRIRNDEHTSRSSYLNNSIKKKNNNNNNNNNNNRSSQKPGKGKSMDFPRASNTGKLYSGNNTKNQSNRRRNSNGSSNHKKGFLPLKSQNGNERKSYHKRF